jgi:hypothetical protein
VSSFTQVTVSPSFIVTVEGLNPDSVIRTVAPAAEGGAGAGGAGRGAGAVGTAAGAGGAALWPTQPAIATIARIETKARSFIAIHYTPLFNSLRIQKKLQGSRRVWIYIFLVVTSRPSFLEKEGIDLCSDFVRAAGL